MLDAIVTIDASVYSHALVAWVVYAVSGLLVTRAARNITTTSPVEAVLVLALYYGAKVVYRSLLVLVILRLLDLSLVVR